MKKLSFILLVTLSSALHAQTLSSITLDKSQAQTGQSVQASVALDADDSANCGLRVDWGDGSGEDVKINDLKKLPYIANHTYAKAGDYTVSATPKKVTSLLGCVGKAKTVAVKIVMPPAPSPAASAPVAAPVVVAAPAPVASAVAVAKPAASATATAMSTCPIGWALNAKSVNKKTKAFTCTAKAGTPTPEKKLSCEGDTGYFENAKKGMIGCRV